MQPELDADVIIVGGGVTGCATAAALSDGKRRIVVLEARRGHKPRFAGELMHPTGAEVLDDLGFLPALYRAGAIDVDGFALVRQRDQPALTLPYSEVPRARKTGLCMDHRELCEAMRVEVARRPGVDLRLGSPVDEVLRDGTGRACGVRSGERLLRAPLVLGCDGRHSKVRPLLGLAEQARLLSFTVAAKLENARELLPHPSYGHVFFGAPGPMLLYPMSDRDVRGCFDVTRDLSGGAKGAAELLLRDYVPQLPERLGQALAEALRREPPQVAATEAIRTNQAVAPGAAIVGDAGGCAHPLTAAGMTVCFTDAQRMGAALAPIADLGDHGRVDAALRSYEIARYRFVRAREVLTDALYEVFQGADPGTWALREGIFRYWGSPRARARSMALLSGADSRLSSFLTEYLTVVGTSSQAALLQAPTAGHGRGAALLGLGKKSLEKLGRVAQDVRQEALR